MKCPNCGKDHNTVVGAVKQSIPYKRYRKCLECGFRFKTYEYYAVEKKKC